MADLVNFVNVPCADNQGNTVLAPMCAQEVRAVSNKRLVTCVNSTGATVSQVNSALMLHATAFKKDVPVELGALFTATVLPNVAGFMRRVTPFGTGSGDSIPTGPQRWPL